jgi:hypothetical protein
MKLQFLTPSGGIVADNLLIPLASHRLDKYARILQRIYYSDEWWSVSRRNIH